MERLCESCGMPMKKPEDFGANDTNNKYCVHCTDQNGNLKGFEIKFEETINFIISRTNVERIVAFDIAKESMKKQPAWKDRF